MAKNVWDLDLDIKFRYSASIPLFRRRDSAVLNMRIYDAKVRKDISNFTKATISIKYPSGAVTEVVANKMGTGIDTYASYQFPESVSLEVGIYDLILTIEKDGGFISTPKFHVAFFDNISQAEYEFVKMMQDMQLQIDFLETLLGNIVPNTQIAQANGLVPLDEQGKIPLAHMPLFLEEHINTNVYLKLVHGFMIDKDKNIVYETKDGNLEYVGHPDNSGANNRLNLTTVVKDSIVKLIYSGKGYATVQRWAVGNKSVADMKTTGTLFTGSEFTVSQTGIHTIYYMDNFNNEYLYKFTIDISQIKTPTVNVGVDNGNIVVDTDTSLEVIKVASGKQTIEWFRTNGTVITKEYRLTEPGEYSVYWKDKQGRETVKYITVTDEQIVREDKDPPTISTKEAPVGYTNLTKTVTVELSDASNIIDRRYYIPDRTERKTIADFRADANLGTKASSNTFTVRMDNNGIFYIYAKDQYGNDTLKQHYVTTIDRNPPTVEAYDIWNGVKNKYEIHFRITDSGSGLKEIILPDGSQYNIDPNTQYFTVEDVIESTNFVTKSFTVTDKVGNVKTYVYRMKGKPMKVFSQDSTLYVIREDGYLYSAGGNRSGLLGTGEEGDAFMWKNTFNRIISDVKFKKLITTAGEGMALLDEQGDIWELGEKYDITYNKVNQVKGRNLIPGKYTGITKVTDMSSPEVNSGSGVSAVLKDGKWLGIGGYFGQIGDGTENEYKTWTELGKAMPVPFTRYIGISNNGYFFGTDGKVYCSGWNNEGLQGGFTPTQSRYQIYATPQECNLINPQGTVYDIVGKPATSLRWWILNGKVLKSGDTLTKQIQTFANMPLASNYIKTSTNNRSGLMIAYKDGLYVTGWNNEGQLGLGHTDEIPEDQLVKVPFDKPIIDATLSYTVGVAIDNTYTLYMTGTGGDWETTTFTEATSLFEEYEQLK